MSFRRRTGALGTPDSFSEGPKNLSSLCPGRTRIENMETKRNLAGKIAVVTGGSRGIGRAIALRLARERVQVVIAARDPSALAEAADEIVKNGGIVETFAADLRDPQAPSALVQAAVNAFGGIDIIVNNAGATRRGEFLELT